MEGEEGALDEDGENEHGQDNNNNEGFNDDDGEGGNRAQRRHHQARTKSGGAAHGLNSGSGGVHQYNFQGHHGEAQRYGAIF